MDPTSVEMLLILKLNSDIWDERSVNDVIKRSAPRSANRTRQLFSILVLRSTPISTVSSSASSTAQSFFSTSGNQQQSSECDDDDNEENDEDEDDQNE